MPIFRASDIQLFAGGDARRLVALGLPPYAETYTFSDREDHRVVYTLLLPAANWAARVAEQEAEAFAAGALGPLPWDVAEAPPPLQHPPTPQVQPEAPQPPPQNGDLPWPLTLLVP